MADVLKQTLYFSADPDMVVESDNTGGSAFVANVLDAAGSQDGSDGSYGSLAAPDDNIGSVNGNATMSVVKALQTASASGDISFVRVKYRAKRANLTNTSGTVQPRINGTERGSATSLTTSYVSSSQDFTTDPADSQPWTNAKVNAQTWGVLVAAVSTAPTYNRTPESFLSEFSVELWGPDVAVVAPSAVGMAATVGAAALVAGLVGLSVAAVGCSTGITDPTLAPGALSHALESVGMTAGAHDEEFVNEKPTVGAQRVQAVYTDSTSMPTIVRSNTAPFGDNSTATKQAQQGMGAGSGTLSWNFGGVAQDYRGGDPIVGVRLFARLRAGKQSGTLSNFRFQLQDGSRALAAQPTVGAWPLAGAYQDVQTADLVTTVNGETVTWDNLHLALLSWGFRADWNVATPFDMAGAEVADAWLEVYSAIGSPPEVIRLRQRMGSVRRQQQFPDTLNN